MARRNVSLPGDYEMKLEKLEEENFFEIYDGFSGWVQDEIDRVIKQTPKARLKLLKDKKHKKRREIQKLEEEINELEEVADISEVNERDEREFFEEFFQWLESKQNSQEYYEESDKEIYLDFESPWIRKFRNQFSKSLRRDEFRTKVKNYLSEVENNLDIQFSGQEG